MYEEQIRRLSLEALEDLSEALLDFTQVADVVTWLQAHQAPSSVRHPEGRRRQWTQPGHWQVSFSLTPGMSTKLFLFRGDLCI